MARGHYLMDGCQYAISLSLNDLYLNFGAHIVRLLSCTVSKTLGLWDYSIQCCRWNLAYGTYVCAFPLFWTVFKNCITGDTVRFTSCKYLAAVRITGGSIPVCPMYFTTSALTSVRQFVPNIYYGATYKYWRHTLCSRRRRRLLTKCTRMCCHVVSEIFVKICVIAVCSHTTAYQDVKAHSNTRL